MGTGVQENDTLRWYFLKKQGPSEGVDLNNMLAANGEYDEESGWVINKYGLGILRPTEDGSYEITDFGTGW